MVKGIAVYGPFVTYEPVFQRYWIRRKDGFLQRYWKKTRRMKKVVMSEGRFEFHGSGKDLYKAVAKARYYIPKDFIDVPAEEFAEHPEEYGFLGEWVDWNVES